MFFSGAGRDQGRATRNTGHPETQMQLNDKGALCQLDVYITNCYYSYS